jgi:hypothetical protein
VSLCPFELYADADVQALIAELRRSRGGAPRAVAKGSAGLALHRLARPDHRFKLGQDERSETLQSILAAHPDPETCRWMERFNLGRF